jgi:hypothetical protein
LGYLLKFNSCDSPPNCVWYVACTVLCNIYNVWLYTRKVPNQIKDNRSILLPKGTIDLDDVNNWRPLTIKLLLGPEILRSVFFYCVWRVFVYAVIEIHFPSNPVLQWCLAVVG